MIVIVQLMDAEHQLQCKRAIGLQTKINLYHNYEHVVRF